MADKPQNSPADFAPVIVKKEIQLFAEFAGMTAVRRVKDKMPVNKKLNKAVYAV